MSVTTYHIEQQRVLSAVAVLTGGYIISFTQVKLTFPHTCIWYVCIYIYGIPVHVAVKVICLKIGLWIFLSKDNVLLLLQYDTGESMISVTQ